MRTSSNVNGMCRAAVVGAIAWGVCGAIACGGQEAPGPVSASKRAAAQAESAPSPADRSEDRATEASVQKGEVAKAEEAATAGGKPPPEPDERDEPEDGDDDPEDDKVAVEVNTGEAKTLMNAPATVGLGGIMKTAGTVGKVLALADRGCACTDAACFGAAKSELDKLVAANSTTKFSSDEVAKLKAAVERFTGCEGKLAAPSAEAAQTDTERKTQGAEPDRAALSMAAAMRLVKGLCGCRLGDSECLNAFMKEAEALAKEFGDDIVYTEQQKLAQKALQAEAEGCAAKHQASATTDSNVAAEVPAAAKVKGPGASVPASKGNYPRGKIQRWDQLPGVVGMSVLQQIGVKRGSPFIDQVWDMSIAQVMAAFPGSKLMEPTDLEPNTRVVELELATKDGRKLVWKFLDDRLFQASLELKRSVPNLHAIVQGIMQRPSDAKSDEGWSMKVSTWTDGGLLVRAIKDGKSTDFSLAFRGRHEEYLRRGRKGREAYVANRAGLRMLAGLKYSRNYQRVEKRFREAIRIAPHYGHAHVNLCRLYFYWGHYSHATSACQRARNSRTNSVHAEAAYYTGLINVVQGYRANGLKWLRHVKSYSPDFKKPVHSANRHIRVVNGRGKKRDFKQAYKEVVCAWVGGDRPRANRFAKSYGYSSAKALGQAAYRYGVKTDKLDRWASKRCR